MRTCTSAIVTCSENAGEDSAACATGIVSTPRKQRQRTNCLYAVMVTPPAASVRLRKNDFGARELRWSTHMTQPENGARHARLAGWARREGNPIWPRCAFLA